MSVGVNGVCFSSVVFKFPNGLRPAQTVTHVGEVCLRAHDREGLAVDLVDAVACIEACEWSYRRADVGDLKWFRSVYLGCVTEILWWVGSSGERRWEVVVEDLDLVLMGVSVRRC